MRLHGTPRAATSGGRVPGARRDASSTPPASARGVRPAGTDCILEGGHTAAPGVRRRHDRRIDAAFGGSPLLRHWTKRRPRALYPPRRPSFQSVRVRRAAASDGRGPRPAQARQRRARRAPRDDDDVLMTYFLRASGLCAAREQPSVTAECARTADELPKSRYIATQERPLTSSGR